MTRVGAIDCGTNSIRLLVADLVEPDGALTLREIERTMLTVRLGEGVDRTGRLDPAALERTFAAARQYADRCRELAVERVRFVATSASRDAENAEEFTTGIASILVDWGVVPEVAAGSEEAHLSFVGATGGVAAAGYPAPYLVVDLGGGSTEFVRGAGTVVAALSTDIGCVRLTERHLRSDPPTADEVTAAMHDVAAALDDAEAEVGFGGIATLVGLAGSVTTVAAHALGLPAYDRDAIHLAELDPSVMEESAIDLLERTRAERQELGFMHPGRVDVIGAGALVWHQVMARVRAASPDVRVIASECDILDGIALSLAR